MKTHSFLGCVKGHPAVKYWVHLILHSAFTNINSGINHVTELVLEMFVL